MNNSENNPKFTTKPTTATQIILCFNIIAAFLLILSFFAPFVNPQQVWEFALLGLGYPLLLAINLIFCGYWIIRKSRFFSISALSLLLGGNLVFNVVNYNSRGQPKKNHGQPFRILAYNVHNFNGLETPINLPAYRPILNLVKQHNPAVLTVEEFYLHSASFKIIDSLKSALKTTHFYFEPFIKTPFDSTGLAIFSKYEIVKKGIIDLSSKQNENRAIFADIKTPTKIIRVYCVHLESLNFSANEYEEVSTFKAPSYFLAKNILRKLRQGYINRSIQVAILKRELATCKYPYIIAGDFNDTPNSYAVQSLSKGLKNSFREKGNGIGNTFNLILPLLQIDYILASPEFTIEDYQIINQKISDHRPIYSDLYLRSN